MSLRHPASSRGEDESGRERGNRRRSGRGAIAVPFHPIQEARHDTSGTCTAQRRACCPYPLRRQRSGRRPLHQPAAPVPDQGSFPPPALPGLIGTTPLSPTPQGRFRALRRHRRPASLASRPRGFPRYTRPLFRTCRRHFPDVTVGCAHSPLPQRRRHIWVKVVTTRMLFISIYCFVDVRGVRTNREEYPLTPANFVKTNRNQLLYIMTNSYT